MTYWNPIERYGVDAFARDLSAAGGTGLITPDLIPDEAGEWLAASDAYGLDRTFLVAPSSTDARLAMTVAHCRGFVYATAVMGVTGARESTSTAAPALVGRVRAVTDLPVGVGLGVGNGAQAAEVGGYFEAFGRAAPAPRGGVEVAFFPPFPILEAVVRAARGRADASVGGQNCHWEARGAFTGEVSAGMIAATGARRVLVGHSERRQRFGETDET
jgi:hypothetical protein